MCCIVMPQVSQLDTKISLFTLGVKRPEREADHLRLALRIRMRDAIPALMELCLSTVTTSHLLRAGIAQSV
jgi:hypothetical protein